MSVGHHISSDMTLLDSSKSTFTQYLWCKAIYCVFNAKCDQRRSIQASRIPLLPSWLLKLQTSTHLGDWIVKFQQWGDVYDILKGQNHAFFLRTPQMIPWILPGRMNVDDVVAKLLRWFLLSSSVNYKTTSWDDLPKKIQKFPSTNNWGCCTWVYCNRIWTHWTGRKPKTFLSQWGTWRWILSRTSEIPIFSK